MLVADFIGLRGRLGNALYQIASTIGVGERLGEPVRFNANWIHRPYYSVPDDYFAEPYVGFATCEFDTTIARAVADEVPPGPTGEWLKEFLQNYDWFADVLPKVRRFFAPSELALEIIAKASVEFDALPRPILSVHVRRGDNAVDPGVRNKHLYWPMPPLSYYQHAIEMLRPQVASVAVFGDDPAWNRENIQADYHHVGVSRPKEHEADYLTAPVLDFVDLALMARSDGGHVLSNSTFGWWGAMLAGDDHAIYPWPIVGPKLPHVKMELALPPTWQRLDYRC
jgi:hypothetical protein